MPCRSSTASTSIRWPRGFSAWRQDEPSSRVPRPTSKNTCVLARALGHGNALLAIAVRRSWSDDRYLLGFYDTFHGRYDPGPTGLATRLLQAEQDWKRDRQGLYLILLDEFNLAAPEYYFSQL